MMKPKSLHHFAVVTSPCIRVHSGNTCKATINVSHLVVI